MALKRLLTKEEFTKLLPHFQSEYKAEGEGYVLDLTDYEDPAALKRAKDHVNNELKEEKKKANEVKDQLAKLTDERDNLIASGIPKADVEKLRTSYESKLKEKETELRNEIASLSGNLKTILVDNVAQSLASEISTAPKVLLPHIQRRITSEMVEGKAVTRILDTEGKPSALSLDDLRKEFLASPDFAPIVTGSKGSGGGAGASKGGGAARKSLKEMTATEEAQFANANPKEYAAMLAATP